jgi:hypothetical protein
MSINPQPSQHAADVRMRELADPRIEATTGDIDAIVEHVAAASFSTKRWSLPVHLRVDFDGVRVGAAAESALYHALKRIVQDRQWSTATSLADYLADVSAAVRSPDAKIAIIRRWNQTTVAFLTATGDIVPEHRQGEAALPFMLVLYSADIGKINTAYMVASETAARIPGHARWLK